jgi:hypothetical protein
MKVSEICERVRSGAIQLNTAGHAVNVTLKAFLKQHDDNLHMAAGGYDGKWSCQSGDSVETVDARMRAHYQRYLDDELHEGESIKFSMGDGAQCFGCGERLRWVLTGDQLQLREHTVDDPTARFGLADVNHPADYVCPFATPQPYKGSITVASRLLIANFFTEIEDSPDESKYQHDWSLNHRAGRRRIADYKASKNVAYGQMGNMSIGVYANAARDSILIGPSSHPAEFAEFDSDEEYETACSQPVFAGYELTDSIILDVWRWEATDLNTLGAERYPEIVKLNQYRGLVELDVPHGNWVFEHFYDAGGSAQVEPSHLYARLDLQK